MMRLMEEEEEETKEKEEGGNDEKTMRLEGLVLAPCCAHKARFAEVNSLNLLVIDIA